MRYIYRKTSTIGNLIGNIETLKKAADILPAPYQQHLDLLRQESTLKSALYSARIEGNPLYEHQLHLKEGQSHHHAEVSNLHRAHQYLYKLTPPITINLQLLLKLHQLSIQSIGPNPGKLRTQASAIFNSAGVAVYLAPPPDLIQPKLTDLIEYINTSNDQPPVIAAITHFAFEKIHPFIDGNGRVGRLLAEAILINADLNFSGLLNLNQYFEHHRTTYYDLLANEGKDITDFVAFYLTAIVHQAKQALANLHSPHQAKPEDSLLPRRQEILNIIRDHKIVSFDFIWRRFSSVPRSTLHYDLKQLLNKGYINKLGSTRAARYCISLPLLQGGG